jgi:hypothetical protein
MALSRMARHFWQEVLHRRIPHGLLHWRYLLPCQSSRLQMHRSLWWRSLPGWPRPLWLGWELWLWVRWVGLSAWYATWRAVRQMGPEVRQQEGLAPYASS